MSFELWMAVVRGVAGAGPRIGGRRVLVQRRVAARLCANSAAGGGPRTKIPTHPTSDAVFFLKKRMVMIAQTIASGVNTKDQVCSVLNAQVVYDE